MEHNTNNILRESIDALSSAVLMVCLRVETL